jgi:uncharacterized protein YjbJ (UPF0337 family)
LPAAPALWDSGTFVAAAPLSLQHQEDRMDKQHIKGAADKAKGSVKEAAGKMTGNERLQAEGKADKAKGSVRNAAGNVKDAARDLTK